MNIQQFINNYFLIPAHWFDEATPLLFNNETESYCSDHNGVVQEAEANEGNGVMKQNWKKGEEQSRLREIIMQNQLTTQL